MTWILLRTDRYINYDQLEKLGYENKGEWDDQEVYKAAQKVINTIDVSIKREAITILKQFLPKPISDVL